MKNAWSSVKNTKLKRPYTFIEVDVNDDKNKKLVHKYGAASVPHVVRTSIDNSGSYAVYNGDRSASNIIAWLDYK